MKNLIKVISLVYVLQSCSASSSGTGSGTSSPSTGTVASEFSKLADGIYIQQNDVCNTTAGFAPFYKMNYSYSNFEFIAMRSEYLDAACTQGYYIKSDVYTFVSSVKVSDHDMVTFSLIDVQLLPEVQTIADSLNSNTSFGYSNWNIQYVKSIIDVRQCVGGPVPYRSGALSLFQLKVIPCSNSIFVNNMQFDKQ